MFPARRLLAALTPLVALAAACGSDGQSATTQSGGGAGGSADQARAGTTGTGASGGAGSLGKAGASGGLGAAGQAGSGGGAAASGSAGAAGAVGLGGSGAGTGGGTMGGCAADSDCPAPFAMPGGCARGRCETKQHTCLFEAVDQDGDGFPTATCKGANGELIKLGNDCDDRNPSIRPGGWDGPKDGDKPDSCGDGVDQDCSGVLDDGKTAKGATCTCVPGDVASCREEAGGKPIAFPNGKPAGECKLGAKTCLAAGTWGPCGGAVAPAAESCNGKDDNCDGVVDDGPPSDAVYWLYDGDDDLHGGKGPGFEPALACAARPPTAAPAGCLAQKLPCAQGATLEACCPPGRWKLAKAISPNDCDDRNDDANPAEKEICGDGQDNDCNGVADDDCTCTPGDSQSCAVTAGGQPMSFPGGVARAPCARGSQICVTSGSGSKWGPCLGAIAPGIETCGNPGVDDDCDGSVDDDPTDAVTYFCDGDADGHLPTTPLSKRACSLPATGCKSWLVAGAKDDCADDDPVRHGGAEETCGDAVDRNCDDQDSDGFDVGASCDVAPTGAGSSSKGACAGGGKKACGGPKQTVCTPLDEGAPGSSRIGKRPDQNWPETSSPNGSDDWSCDGIPEYSIVAGQPLTLSRSAFDACLTDAQICAKHSFGKPDCLGVHVVPATALQNGLCCSCEGINCPASCYDPVVRCGEPTMRVITCYEAFGNQCTVDSSETGKLTCR